MEMNFNIPFSEFGGNGIVYSKEAIEKAVEEYNEHIKEKRSLGELGPRSEMSIDLSCVSHIVTNVETTDDGVKGKLEVITSKGYDTQGVISTCGDQLAAMMECGNMTVEPFMIGGKIVSFDVVR